MTYAKAIETANHRGKRHISRESWKTMEPALVELIDGVPKTLWTEEYTPDFYGTTPTVWEPDEEDVNATDWVVNG